MSSFTAIAQDPAGTFWVPSAGLIFRRDASDTLLRFDHTNGVQVRDLNLNADVNLKPNILLLGGNEGINLISTESVQINTRTPPVQMANLFLNNKKKKLLDAEELQLNRNFTYTNLDPGSYLLPAQGPNNDGVWNEDGLNIPITINPPLWATWWAYCAYAAFALFLFYQLMVGSRRINREAEDRFNRRLKRYVASLDDTAECVLNANRQGSVMFFNNAVASVLGKRPSEVGDYSLFEILFQEEGQREEAKKHVDNGKNFHQEVPYLMSDGSGKVLEISVSPALETTKISSTDDVACVSIVRDVTQRSREQADLRLRHDQLAEELANVHDQLESAQVKNVDQRADFNATLAEKDILLREIHDRVYDNLEMLTSLLSIQSHKHTDPEILNILRENQRRISSIALVHERLYQSNEIRRVAMADYVDVLLSSLYRKLVPEALEITLVKELAAFDLAIDLAVPCGLIINELFSNALLHGFSGTQHRSGTIEVKLYLLAKECVIFVSDSGRGLPKEVSTQAGSMGFEIVSILVEQLEGSFRLIGGPGTTFEVRFPVLQEGVIS